MPSVPPTLATDRNLTPKKTTQYVVIGLATLAAVGGYLWYRSKKGASNSSSGTAGTAGSIQANDLSAVTLPAGSNTGQQDVIGNPGSVYYVPVGSDIIGNPNSQYGTPILNTNSPTGTSDILPNPPTTDAGTNPLTTLYPLSWAGKQTVGTQT